MVLYGIVSYGIDVNDLDNVNSVKFLHLVNIPLPIVSTVSGIVIDFKDEQKLNTFSPICFIFDPKWIFSNLPQSANVSNDNSINPSGNLNEINWSQHLKE